MKHREALSSITDSALTLYFTLFLLVQNLDGFALVTSIVFSIDEEKNTPSNIFSLLILEFPLEMEGSWSENKGCLKINLQQICFALIF